MVSSRSHAMGFMVQLRSLTCVVAVFIIWICGQREINTNKEENKQLKLIKMAYYKCMQTNLSERKMIFF